MNKIMETGYSKGIEIIVIKMLKRDLRRKEYTRI
jgi:hypothetical protein